VSLATDAHIGVYREGLDARLVLFSDCEHGPYMGSVVGLVDERGDAYPPLERQAAFGDALGVYYRYFR